MIVFPVVALLFIVPGPEQANDPLVDFSRFTKAIGADIAIVDREGTVCEGRLTSVSADEVTVDLLSGIPRTYRQEMIASADRLKDGNKDGFIKGAIVGAIAGVFATQGTSTTGEGIVAWLGAVAIYGGIGWSIDAAQGHRQPIYRAPAPAPSVKLSLRF